MKHPIQIAIDHLATTQKGLADDLGVSPSFVSQCLSGHRKLPIEHCKSIELMTGGLVTRDQLRPDIYDESKAA